MNAVSITPDYGTFWVTAIDCRTRSILLFGFEGNHPLEKRSSGHAIEARPALEIVTQPSWHKALQEAWNDKRETCHGDDTSSAIRLRRGPRSQGSLWKEKSAGAMRDARRGCMKFWVATTHRSVVQCLCGFLVWHGEFSGASVRCWG